MLVGEIIERYDGRASPKKIRAVLRETFANHARGNAPHYTRRIWAEEVANAFLCGGALSIPDARRRMKQLGLPLPACWLVRPSGG